MGEDITTYKVLWTRQEAVDLCGRNEKVSQFGKEHPEALQVVKEKLHCDYAKNSLHQSPYSKNQVENMCRDAYAKANEGKLKLFEEFVCKPAKNDTIKLLSKDDTYILEIHRTHEKAWFYAVSDYFPKWETQILSFDLGRQPTENELTLIVRAIRMIGLRSTEDLSRGEEDALGDRIWKIMYPKG